MELFVITLLLVVLAQTSYLTYKHTNRASVPGGSILMDTSALIDGRIVAIARSGLISAQLIVPKSVVAELQFMADKADHDKRERARFGLDVIDALQQLDTVELRVVDDYNDDKTEVDEQLMKLALAHKARLCTIDYNLNKAARVQKIEVININELAHALRIVHLPGEQTIVKIVQPGQERDQGVGYLDDGTMVVVDNARKLIEQEVEVTITRALQTAAGKMMFAKLVSAPKRPAKAQPSIPAKQEASRASAAENKGRGKRFNAAPKSRKSTEQEPAPEPVKGKRSSRRQSPQQRAESNLLKLVNQDETTRD